MNIYNHTTFFPPQFFYSLLYNFIIFPPQCFYSLLHIFISDGDFGRSGLGRTTLTWREKQTLRFSRGDGRRRFFHFIEGSREWVPWKRSERFWSTFIWWCHIRWGIRSLVQWKLVEHFVTLKRMLVASLSPFAIYLWATFSHTPQFLE